MTRRCTPCLRCRGRHTYVFVPMSTNAGFILTLQRYLIDNELALVHGVYVCTLLTYLIVNRHYVKLCQCHQASLKSISQPEHEEENGDQCSTHWRLSAATNPRLQNICSLQHPNIGPFSKDGISIFTSNCMSSSVCTSASRPGPKLRAEPFRLLLPFSAQSLWKDTTPRSIS